ncbi:MAG: RNA polymerase sigma factor [Candidatus Limnocylindria bacterium]
MAIAMAEPTQVVDRMDSESRRWLERLAPESRDRDAALAELRELLLRAARFEVRRRCATLSQIRGGDQEDMAEQSAGDAMVAILSKLDSFRGESQFTTWAYKFALYEAAVKIRKLAWQGRELPLEAEEWSLMADPGPAPHGEVEMNDLLAAIREAIETGLTPRQREVLVALALNEVPIDVLADRLGSTRGALYKTLHDARRKLRAALADRGLIIDEPAEEAK